MSNDLLLSLPRDDRQARYLRDQIRRWSPGVGLTDPQLEDALLVASELLSNAVRAAEPDTTIDFQLANSTTGVSVRMENTGPGFDVDALPAPSRQRHGGRGIAIMRALGALTVNQVADQTIVTVLLNAPLAVS
jgi:anti-sigma regulatory factor (Ser/Thr protein kinase)